MTKPILYIDMDGVIADFRKAIRDLAPHIDTSIYNPDQVDEVCKQNPDIFHNLEPIPGAVEAINKLFLYYDIYFLSTPMWSVPESFTGKRVWIEKHFGYLAEKRLILTHRKDLCIGHFLIDDTKRHGADKFEGMFLHFGQYPFENWDEIGNFLYTMYLVVPAREFLINFFKTRRL